MIEGVARRKEIKEFIKRQVETVRQQYVEQAVTKKTSKKVKDNIKAVKKVEQTQIDNICEVLFKILMLRHEIKLLWFDANKRDRTETDEEFKQEELPEEQEQKYLEKRHGCKLKAIKRNEELESYVDKLVSDSKYKAILMKGISFIQDSAPCPQSKGRFHTIDVDIGKSERIYEIYKKIIKADLPKAVDSKEKEKEKVLKDILVKVSKKTNAKNLDLIVTRERDKARLSTRTLQLQQKALYKDYVIPPEKETSN